MLTTASRSLSEQFGRADARHVQMTLRRAAHYSRAPVACPAAPWKDVAGASGRLNPALAASPRAFPGRRSSSGLDAQREKHASSFPSPRHPKACCRGRGCWSAWAIALCWRSACPQARRLARHLPDTDDRSRPSRQASCPRSCEPAGGLDAPPLPWWRCACAALSAAPGCRKSD